MAGGGADVAARWLRSRPALGGAARKALTRLRGDPDLDRLVADGLQLGQGVFIARGAHLDPGRPWLISIGDQAVLSPGVFVLTHDASMAHRTGLTRIARVEIGKRVMLGACAIILPGATIGDDAVIGAGAVVRGEIAPGSVAVGNPARVVSSVDLMAAWQTAAAASAPSWPYEGWSRASGITAERKLAQRAALANGISGYVEAPTAHGAPPRPGP